METLYTFAVWNRRIKTYGGYFQAFAKTLDKEVLRKIDYLLQLLKSEERLSSRFVKLIREGLFELRISVKGNIYIDCSSSLTRETS